MKTRPLLIATNIVTGKITSHNSTTFTGKSNLLGRARLKYEGRQFIMHDQIVVHCKELRKTYEGKVEAVRGIDLTIYAGQCYGLLGPNGAGKTTTIEILEGLLEASSGTVEILSLNWRQHAEELRESLGVSLQETRLSEKLTVRETLQLFGGFYRYARPVEDVLEELALT